MVKIKNPIKFPTWERFTSQTGFCQELKSITYGISSDDLQTIRANCRWCYTSAENKKEFPYTEHGYQDACSWIEDQRVKLIEELL